MQATTPLPGSSRLKSSPPECVATAHGISAACGKCGAVLTAFAFGAVTNKIGLKGVLGFFSGIMALVAVLTLLIPKTRGASVDDIEIETLFIGKAMSSHASSTKGSPQIVEVEMGQGEEWIRSGLRKLLGMLYYKL
jgi:PHS family inorganic phosphate transporter-like MFS transporter